MLSKTFTVAALAAAAAAQNSTMNITATLSSIPELSNLTTYLALYPQIVQQLEAAQNVTLLAPSNTAFAKAMNTTAGMALAQNQTALITDTFLYHILMGTYYASEISTTPAFVPTYLSPQTNATLLEPGAVVEVLKSGSNVEVFSGLLTKSTVTSANHNFTGGTLHVIDTFLTPPQNISATLVPLNYTDAAGALRAANTAAGPLPANLTAFIPSNMAFESIANILANASTATLQKVLGYHLIPNITAYSTSLKNESLITTIGENVTITDNNGTFYVNGAKVIVPNILVQEGVVHVIDAVLNPANTTQKPASSTEVAFSGASSGTSLPFTSGIPVATSVPAGATGGGAAAATASSGSGSSGSGSSSSSSGIAARPVQTGAMGVAALFAAGGLIAQL